MFKILLQTSITGSVMIRGDVNLWFHTITESCSYQKIIKLTLCHGSVWPQREEWYLLSHWKFPGFSFLLFPLLKLWDLWRCSTRYHKCREVLKRKDIVCLYVCLFLELMNASILIRKYFISGSISAGAAPLPASGNQKCYWIYWSAEKYHKQNYPAPSYATT